MIRLEGLTKRFKQVTAVDNVSLMVVPGQIYGFLGPNGAGKTTTIKMLAGLLAPIYFVPPALSALLSGPRLLTVSAAVAGSPPPWTAPGRSPFP